MSARVMQAVREAVDIRDFRERLRNQIMLPRIPVGIIDDKWPDAELITVNGVATNKHGSDQDERNQLAKGVHSLLTTIRWQSVL